MSCRGCGVETRMLHYRLCVKCRLLPPHKRPLNPRYIPPRTHIRVRKVEKKPEKKTTKPIHLWGREYLVCGCDYMLQPLDVKQHSPLDCPNSKTIRVATGHENG